MHLLLQKRTTGTGKERDRSFAAASTGLHPTPISELNHTNTLPDSVTQTSDEYEIQLYHFCAHLQMGDSGIFFTSIVAGSESTPHSWSQEGKALVISEPPKQSLSCALSSGRYIGRWGLLTGRVMEHINAYV